MNIFLRLSLPVLWKYIYCTGGGKGKNNFPFKLLYLGCKILQYILFFISSQNSIIENM